MPPCICSHHDAAASQRSDALPLSCHRTQFDCCFELKKIFAASKGPPAAQAAARITVQVSLCGTRFRSCKFHQQSRMRIVVVVVVASTTASKPAGVHVPSSCRLVGRGRERIPASAGVPPPSPRADARPESAARRSWPRSTDPSPSMLSVGSARTEPSTAKVSTVRTIVESSPSLTRLRSVQYM